MPKNREFAKVSPNKVVFNLLTILHCTILFLLEWRNIRKISLNYFGNICHILFLKFNKYWGRDLLKRG